MEHTKRQWEALQARIVQYEEELKWIDSHLFQPVDTAAIRKFIKRDSIEARRLLRICDLLDSRDGLVAVCRSMLKALQNINPDAADEIYFAEVKMQAAIAEAEKETV